MDTAVLEIFIEVVRRGSFAEVARDRRADPSSISRSIASLERDLGVRLLQRTTRQVVPTEAGIAYFERVEPIVEELSHAREIATDVGERPKGTLRISAPVSFAELNLVDLLPELSARYPDLSLDLVLTDATPDMLSEHIDVSLRMGPLSDSTLIAHRLTSMNARVCAGPNYIDRHGRPQKPADLKEHNCMLLAMPGFGPHWQFRKTDGTVEEVTVTGNCSTSNAIALKKFTMAGMGITVQARWTAGRELREGTLVDLFPDYEVTASFFDNAIWVLYPTRTYLPLKVRFFVDFLKEKFRDGAPWDCVN